MNALLHVVCSNAVYTNAFRLLDIQNEVFEKSIMENLKILIVLLVQELKGRNPQRLIEKFSSTFFKSYFWCRFRKCPVYHSQKHYDWSAGSSKTHPCPQKKHRFPNFQFFLLPLSVHIEKSTKWCLQHNLLLTASGIQGSPKSMQRKQWMKMMTHFKIYMTRKLRKACADFCSWSRNIEKKVGVQNETDIWLKIT